MEPSTPRAFISVGVPAYNEIDSLPRLYERLEAVMAQIGESWELVVIDNCSTDGTREYLRELTGQDRRVKAVLLSRNFGHGGAHMNALEHTSGTWTVVMDADLQDEPELIPRMLDKAREGFDVVYAIRASRPEGPAMRFATAAFYRLLGLLSSVPQPSQAGPFSLISRRVVEEIIALRERNVFFPGLRAYVGYRQAGLPLDRPARADGKPRLGLRERFRHGLDGIFAFSSFPLRFAAWLGIVVSVFATVLGVVLLCLWMFTGVEVAGLTALMTVLLFAGGIQLLTLGIVGEFLGRVYDEVKQRPRYFVEERLNLDGP